MHSNVDLSHAELYIQDDKDTEHTTSRDYCWPIVTSAGVAAGDRFH